MAERVGFVGLGIMGSGMAANLLKAGYALTVWNRTTAKADPVREHGAAVAASPRAVAEASDVTFICVSDTPDVDAVLFGDDGIMAGAKAGSLVIDTSTVSPDATREWAARLAEQGVGLIDAPVSGGSEGAANGTLSVMAGGKEDDVARAEPLLNAIGSTVTHLGDAGSGQMCKLVNQVLVVVTMLGVSEALTFAAAGGLDLQKTIAAVEGGAAGSWMLSNRGPQAIADDWRPGFTVDLQQKDLRLVLAEADELRVPMLATSTVFQLYRTLQREGLGAEGNHALIKAVERLAGITARV
jgi:3-hydroxyisobutyrate dehydrogenase